MWSLAAGSHIPDGYTSNAPSTSNVDLYRAIVHQMQAGMGYYGAVAIEQPARHFPVSPVMAVREPTLAWLSALGGTGVMYAALVALGILAAGAMVWRLGQVADGRPSWVVACVLMGGSVGLILAAKNSQMHEFWSAFLMILSVCLRTDKRFAASVLLALAAVLFRELCLPYLLVMGVMALLDHRRREAVAWTAAVLAFFGFYSWHAHEVATQLKGVGQASKGWMDLPGWPFTVDAIWFSTVLRPIPWIAACVLVLLALIGWSSRTGGFGTRVTALLLTYAVVFGIIARHDNVYWGLLLGALFVPGIAFAPRALVSLGRPVASR